MMRWNIRSMRSGSAIAGLRVLDASLSRLAAEVKPSLALELHVFVRRGERVARDEPQPRLPHARSDAIQPCNLIDRRDDHVVVDQLLDAVHGRLPPLPIQLTRLLPEEPVNVRVASVRVDATPHEELL